MILPRESHGQRSLMGYSLWGHTESDTTNTFIFNDADFEISSRWLSSPWRYPLLSPPGRNGYHGPWRVLGEAWVADQGSTCIGLALSNCLDEWWRRCLCDLSIGTACCATLNSNHQEGVKHKGIFCPTGRSRAWQTTSGWLYSISLKVLGKSHSWVQSWPQWTSQNFQFCPLPDIWKRARLFEPSWGFRRGWDNELPISKVKRHFKRSTEKKI